MLKLLVLILFALPGLAAGPASTLHVKVRMRDGVRLCTNFFRPAPQGRYPVVLLRTAYRKPDQLTPNLRSFVDHGYAVVVQDVRGRHHSQGEFQPLVQEQRDGEDALDWIAAQPWSDGRVGMFGGSYNGIAQWRAALSGHPALRAIAPAVSGGDDYLDRYYSRGGAFKFGHRVLWIAENFKPGSWPRPDFSKIERHLPLRTADRAFTGKTLEFFQMALDHPSYDGYWSFLSTRRRVDRVRAAALIMAGWYDNYAESDLEMFAALRDLGRPVRLVIGPWGHNLSPVMPEADFGPEAGEPLRPLEIAWFDAFVKKASAAPATGVRYFLMGANRWVEAPDWPPPTRDLHLFLHGSAPANTARGGGDLIHNAAKRSAPDGFEYDPANPVPTLGGAVCCNARVFPWGPLDQRPVEGRGDVLVYTSAVLKSDLEVTGTVEAVLHVASSAPDTDFAAKLIDVEPDGRAVLVSDGILRMRYRNGVDRPRDYQPGRVERVVVPMGITARVFKAGHRIRLHVSSSNYPRFDRNPNTGGPIADEIKLRKARQTVHHDAERPSYLSLPVRIAGSGRRSLR